MLIRPPRPCSPSVRRVLWVSLQLPAKASSPSSARRGPQAWFPEFLVSPSPDCAPPASLPPAPPTAPPRQYQVPPLPPYLSRPPLAPPTACSPVPVTLLGVYAWSPPRTPLGAPEPPGAPARQPRSLAAADGVAARAGAAEPRAQLARGRREPPPTQPGPVPGPRWPVAPSGPEGEEVGGRGGWAVGWPRAGSSRARAPTPLGGLALGWAPQRAGGGQDPRAAGRSCPLPPRLRSLPALAKSPERPEVESPPPPATSYHTHLFSFPCPRWYPYSPSSLVSISPSASSGSHTGGIIRQNTRLKRMDAPVSSYRPLPYPWILSFAEVGGPEIFSGVGEAIA